LNVEWCLKQCQVMWEVEGEARSLAL
jgi:hypothetical protein